MENLLKPAIVKEIETLADFFQVDRHLLYHIAHYTLATYQDRPKKQKISLSSLKKAIFLYFCVNNTKELKQAATFRRVTQDIAPLNLVSRRDWQRLYEMFIAKLPSSEINDIYNEATREMRLNASLKNAEIDRAFVLCKQAAFN